MKWINNNDTSGNSDYSFNPTNSSARYVDPDQDLGRPSDMWDSDTLGSELYQATIGQPMSLRSGNWERTFDQWWNDGESGEGELVDHGLYTMWDKSWQEQDYAPFRLLLD